jgi:F0F1-type ATP synthase membrane subunit b/b'
VNTTLLQEARLSYFLAKVLSKMTKMIDHNGNVVPVKEARRLQRREGFSQIKSTLEKLTTAHDEYRQAIAKIEANLKKYGENYYGEEGVKKYRGQAAGALREAKNQAAESLDKWLTYLEKVETEANGDTSYLNEDAFKNAVSMINQLGESMDMELQVDLVNSLGDDMNSLRAVEKLMQKNDLYTREISERIMPRNAFEKLRENIYQNITSDRGSINQFNHAVSQVASKFDLGDFEYPSGIVDEAGMNEMINKTLGLPAE